MAQRSSQRALVVSQFCLVSINAQPVTQAATVLFYMFAALTVRLCKYVSLQAYSQNSSSLLLRA